MKRISYRTSQIYCFILSLFSFWVKRTEGLANMITCLVQEDSKVLDFGCGNFEIARHILRHYQDIHITGVDIKQPHGDLNEQLAFETYAYEKLPFSEKSFDYAIVVDVLHHLHNIEQIEEVLKNIISVTKKQVIIHDYQFHNWFQWKLLKVTDMLSNSASEVACTYEFLSPESWDLLIKKLDIKSFKVMHSQVEMKKSVGIWIILDLN